MQIIEIGRSLRPRVGKINCLEGVIEWGMSRKEAPTSESIKATSPELMERLIRSFGNEKWETSQYFVNNVGVFIMWMQSPAKTKMIEYLDYHADPGNNYIEVNFWDRDKLGFGFRQIMGERGIENYVMAPPFKDEYFHPKLGGYGILYRPDGRMDPIKNIKGLPRKIDMDATVTAFIEQIIQGKFNRPLLIRPGR